MHVSRERVSGERRRAVLNLRASRAGLAASALGSCLISIFMVERALGGRRARKLRAVLPDLGLKGEKAVETEVKKRVIILAVYAMRQGRLWELGDY